MDSLREMVAAPTIVNAAERRQACRRNAQTAQGLEVLIITIKGFDPPHQFFALAAAQQEI